MKCNQVSLKEVMQQLNTEISSSIIKDKWQEFFTPSAILTWLEDNRIEYELFDLPFWESWEEGNDDIDENELLKLFVGGNFEENQEQVVVIFDDCFETGMAIETTIKDLMTLKNELDEGTSFLEPFDHVFWIKSKNELIVVHHEGNLIKAQLSDNNKVWK